MKKGSTTWAKSGLSSAKKSTLTFTMSSGYDGIQFRCVVTNEGGESVYSEAATISMKTGPEIIDQPTSVEAALGIPVSISISASGSDLTYQWQYQKAGRRTWNNSTSSGNKTDTLKVSATSGTNGMKFRCIVTDADGNVSISDYAVLTAK